MPRSGVSVPSILLNCSIDRDLESFQGTIFARYPYKHNVHTEPENESSCGLK
jgi:hypothetical protein